MVFQTLNATGTLLDHQLTHFDSNRIHNWNLYKDQEVPKCIQQLVESHIELSNTDKSILDLNKHFIKEQAMERAHIQYVIGMNYSKKHMLSKSPNPFNDGIPNYNVLTMNYNPTPQVHKIKRLKRKEKENETNKEKPNP